MRLPPALPAGSAEYNASEQLRKTLKPVQLYHHADPSRKRDYFQVDVSIDSDGFTTFMNSKSWIFYVRRYDTDTRPTLSAASYYKSAALTMFQVASEHAERRQGNSRITSGSSWSLEDLVSDLIAFYRHVDGITQEKVVELAGGWPNPSREEFSGFNDRLAFSVMDSPQPRTTANGNNWFQAFLINDKGAWLVRRRAD